MASRPTLLIINQVYVPDPASVGQHMADVAEEMVRRGWRVVVLAADRGFDDPSQRYPRREVRGGVEIRRLPFSSWGKSRLRWRLVAAAIFLIQAIIHGLFVRRLACVLYSTSPPICPAAATLLGLLRRVPTKYWVMDLNPDQAIAMGKASASSLPARLMRWMNRWATRRASDVVVLDRFMAERVAAYGCPAERMTIIPPWPHEQALAPIDHADNPFRAAHQLAGKFVVMYSGNHSPASPLDTLVEVALTLRTDDRFRFLFIGGGLGKRVIEEAIAREQPGNMLSLPYQPLAELRYSLSAADLHVVTLGTPMVGIIHPCKVYGALAVSRPILYIGPVPSHVTELVAHDRLGWQVTHGETERLRQALLEAASLAESEIASMRERARHTIRERYAAERLCGAFCDVVERGLPGNSKARAASSLAANNNAANSSTTPSHSAAPLDSAMPSHSAAPHDPPSEKAEAATHGN